ncbi:phosphate/phosphite/phosphonate ABC transporter substrate-binding protein [Coleofasciculus sp. H7-2]|uniref:phosphate/phosphite/phosphonate ABC transporter substrate-binding protein n=1 Tax=Coleofasciculus sp. H7-2 TaxID=3351545 RepID=UPI00366FFDBA
MTVTYSCVACTQPSENTRATSPSTDPQPASDSSNTGDELTTLNMAVIPWQVSAEQEKQLQPLADYLSKTLGKPVKFQITKDYDTSIDLLVTGKVEMAFLGPLSYVKAHLRDPQVQPIVAPIERTTGRPWYTSAIVVNNASGIKTLKDLKGKRFAFVSKSSTSGYLVPLAHFQDIGINPERDFATVKYAGSHDKAKAALLAGNVDAIADDKRSYLQQQKEGNIDPSKYKIIWESDPIPLSPIVVSSKLPSHLIIDLKKAFVNSPEGLLDPSGSQSAGYTLVEDRDYTPIRKLQERLKLK